MSVSWNLLLKIVWRCVVKWLKCVVRVILDGWEFSTHHHDYLEIPLSSSSGDEFHDQEYQDFPILNLSILVRYHVLTPYDIAFDPGTLFKMYMACLTASAQKFCGMLVAFIMHLVVDMIVLFLLSTTPFCCGE
ncbi:hypothetical protein Tco_1501604 [Tanacetum coccineum]